MSHAWRAAIAMALGLVLLLAGVAGSIAYTNREVRELCSIVNLVAETPAPADASSHNPSREYLVKIHDDFVQVRHVYGC